MNRIGLHMMLGLMVALGCLLPAVAPAAVLNVKAGAITAGGNGEGLESGSSIGVSGDFPLGRRWSIEPGLAMHRGELERSGRDAWFFDADLRFRLGERHEHGRFYFVAGGGVYAKHYDEYDGTPASNGTHIGIPAGIGVERRFGGPWILGVEGIHHLVITETGLEGGNVLTYFTWTASLGYALGATMEHDDGTR